MAQEDLKQNDRSNRLRPQGSGDEPPRKGPRFSIYWVWAAIAVILIGFNVFSGKLSPTAEETSQQDFFDMLSKGEVEKVDIISNKNMVRVYLDKQGLNDPANIAKLNKKNAPSSASTAGPHFQFTIGKPEIFADDLRE